MCGVLMMKRYVIVNPKRFFMFLTFVFALLSIILFIFINSTKAHSSIYEVRYKEYFVNPGDNLWNISINNIPKDFDVRKMVYEIRKVNNLETAYIYPGDIIKIPIYEIESN